MARSLPAYARSNVMPGSGFGISRRTFEQIEDFIRDNQNSIIKASTGIDLLLQGMGLVIKSEAMRKSFGPVAAKMRSNPALAYRIPVQRITGAYHAGWYVRRLARGHWVVGNSSFEAYLIETGLFMRVRRPILKMSFIAMMRFIQTTRTAERWVDWVMAPRRNTRGQFQSFKTRIAPFVSGSNANLAGPVGWLP